MRIELRQYIRRNQNAKSQQKDAPRETSDTSATSK
jgi:hypothetical protein